MTVNPSERTRAIVAETLPLVEQHRAEMEEALERYVARRGPDDPSSDRPKVTTGAIMEMLIGHVRQLDGSGPASGIAETSRRHRTLALGGAHYSCFGDALVPIMRDVLRSKATPPVLAAWTDAYWAIVHNLFRHETRLAA